MPLALLCSFGAVHAFADVFWRSKSGPAAALEQLGGSRVYETDVLLNGTDGKLAAYAFHQLSAGDLRPKLARLFDAPASSGDALFLTHADKGRLYRIFVLPSADGSSSCVALAFDQSLENAHADRATGVWPSGLPAVAGTPVFSAVCAATRTAFGVAETETDPSAALQSASQTLRETGWAEAPASRSGTFRMFSSGKKICLLFASSSPASGKNTISVLQREGATP